MMTEGSSLSYSEKLGFALCDLYRSYGYLQYRMSKFEEYDLYARNKDFLISDAVLTFTDLSGKLLALKPDVTLSIVRNTRDDASDVQKVYYTENVYRVARGGGSFQEILQTGLECIGEIDAYNISEVLMLAAESLNMISERCVLEISNLDILSDVIDGLRVTAEYRQKIIKCIAEKNLHELAEICRMCGAESESASLLLRLLRINGTPEKVLPELERIGCSPAAVTQLKDICENLCAVGFANLLRIDFSLVSDMTYYNGIVFCGFVDGVPVGVVSGGQYDRLMDKMGRSSGAIGFAVYLDALERLGGDAPEFDMDMVLLYDNETSTSDLCSAMKRLTEQSLCVTARRSVPEKLKYRQLAVLKGSEVVILETNT